MATKGIVYPCPCTKDCEKRTVHCKATCSAYKFYEIFKRREYEERAKEVNVYEAYKNCRYRHVRRTAR